MISVGCVKEAEADFFSRVFPNFQSLVYVPKNSEGISWYMCFIKINWNVRSTCIHTSSTQSWTLDWLKVDIQLRSKLCFMLDGDYWLPFMTCNLSREMCWVTKHLLNEMGCIWVVIWPATLHTSIVKIKNFCWFYFQVWRMSLIEKTGDCRDDIDASLINVKLQTQFLYLLLLFYSKK